MMTSEVRPIDRVRAAQMVAAQVTGDAEMFAAAVQATLDDDWRFGELGSLINVLRCLSEDLAAGIVDRHGDDSADLVRQVLAGHLAEVDE